MRVMSELEWASGLVRVLVRLRVMVRGGVQFSVKCKVGGGRESETVSGCHQGQNQI